MGLSLGVDKVVGTRNKVATNAKVSLVTKPGQKFRFLTAIERIKMTEQVLVVTAVVLLAAHQNPLGDPSS
jgi:hypothetical protein